MAAAGTARGKTKQVGRKKVESVEWPLDDEGQPMTQISVTASELIPTGNYANVTVGPVTATKFVKDRSDETVTITDEDGDEVEISGLAEDINKLAEMIEVDVVGVQRAIVLATLQADVEKQQGK